MYVIKKMAQTVQYHEHKTSVQKSVCTISNIEIWNVSQKEQF